VSKLEKRLREIAEQGELVGLSIVPVAGKGPNDLVFVATYQPATRYGAAVARNADPVTAMLEALDGELPPEVGELVTPLTHTPRKKPQAPEPPPVEPWEV